MHSSANTIGVYQVLPDLFSIQIVAGLDDFFHDMVDAGIGTGDRVPATPGQKATNTSVDPSSVRSKRTMNETVTF
jgi:hypothetical protein